MPPFEAGAHWMRSLHYGRDDSVFGRDDSVFGRDEGVFGRDDSASLPNHFFLSS